MGTGQRLADFEMQRTEEARRAWEWAAAVLALVVAIAAPLLIEAGPLLY